MIFVMTRLKRLTLFIKCFSPILLFYITSGFISNSLLTKAYIKSWWSRPHLCLTQGHAKTLTILNILLSHSKNCNRAILKLFKRTVLKVFTVKFNGAKSISRSCHGERKRMGSGSNARVLILFLR